MIGGPDSIQPQHRWAETVPETLSGERIDRFVAMLTELSRGEVADLIRAGAVQIGAQVVTARSARVATGDLIQVDASTIDRASKTVVGEDNVVVPTVYVDDQLIVVDKPPELVVHPGAGHYHGTMVQGLLARYPELSEVGDPSRPGIVHRLDRGTSGLLVVARTQEAFDSLVAQLASRTVDRRYLAMIWGHLDPPRGMIDAPIARSRRDPTRMTLSARGKDARTTYKTQALFSEPVTASLISCKLETGRTHQIRVHLSAIGHPIVGDHRYGGVRKSLSTSRQFLHAAELSFVHPGTQELVSYSSGLPQDLGEVLDRLR